MRKFNNSNIGTANAIQNKFVYLQEMGQQIKSSLLIKTRLQKVCSYFSFHLTTIQLFISTWGKSYEDMYHSFPHVFVITGNILNNDNKTCPLPSSACFHQQFHDWFSALRYNLDLSKFEWTLLLFNFSTASVIWQIGANCSPFQSLSMLPFHIRFRTLKTNLLGLISNFSKYYFKTGTVCLLFLFSHVFTTLEYDNNHFGT